MAAFDFVRDVLLLEAPPDADEAAVCERDLFVGRFQQVTSPVTAKGIEDTAFYRYFPLASLNEVGGDPAAGRRQHRGVPSPQPGAADTMAAIALVHDHARQQAERGRAGPDQRAVGDSRTLAHRP